MFHERNYLLNIGRNVRSENSFTKRLIFIFRKSAVLFPLPKRKGKQEKNSTVRCCQSHIQVVETLTKRPLVF